MGNNKHLSMKFVFSSLCIFLALFCIIPRTSAAGPFTYSLTVTFSNLADAAAFNAGDTNSMYPLGMGTQLAGFTMDKAAPAPAGQKDPAAGLKGCCFPNARRGLTVTCTMKADATFAGTQPTPAEKPTAAQIATGIAAVIAAQGASPKITAPTAANIVVGAAGTTDVLAQCTTRDAAAAAAAATPAANATANATGSASCTGQFSLVALFIPVVAMVISKM